MFEDFDSMDMYGFLDYLDESADLLTEEAIMESYGIFEENGQLYIDEDMVYSVMESYDLDMEDAIDVIMESFEEELSEGPKALPYSGGSNLPAPVHTPAIRKNNKPASGGSNLPAPVHTPARYVYQGEVVNDVGPHRPENKRNKFDDHEVIEAEWREVDDKPQQKQLPNGKTALALPAPKQSNALPAPKQSNALPAPKEEPKQPTTSTTSEPEAAKGKKFSGKHAAMAAGGAGVAAVGGVLAHKAYKAHKAKKEEEARRNRGLRGKMRRLRNRLREDYDFELAESYGLIEENGELLFDEETVYAVMESYGIDMQDAMDLMMESCEDELLGEKFSDFVGSPKNLKNSGKEFYSAAKGYGQAHVDRFKAKREGDDIKYGDAESRITNSGVGAAGKQFAKDAAIPAAGIGAAAVGGVLAHKAYKNHKAKKAAAARRNRGLMGKIRRLREDYGIYEMDGELFIENEVVEMVMNDYNLYEEDAINVIMESYEEELYSEDFEDDFEDDYYDELSEAAKYQNKEQAMQISRYQAGMNPKNGTDHSVRNKRLARNGAIAGGAGLAVAGGVLAHKAIKKHKAKKAEKKHSRKRRLREDYGIYEENGELFIDLDMIDMVMESYDLDEEDAMDVIMESYEEELYSEDFEDELSEAAKYQNKEQAMQISRYQAGMNPKNGTDRSVRNKRLATGGAIAGGAGLAVAGGVLAHKAYKKHKQNAGKKGKKRLREDSALNVAHAVSSDSHYHVSDDAYKLYRQAEMDEGDADRNLARGGKNILGGIRQAPRSEQDKAGREGVRFKNRVDDGDMDGEFIDSGIQKPMGAGRRIAEDSDMGF